MGGESLGGAGDDTLHTFGDNLAISSPFILVASGLNAGYVPYCNLYLVLRGITSSLPNSWARGGGDVMF